MTSVIFRVNHTTTDHIYGISGEDLYIDVALADTLIFSNGSDDVKDGENIPTPQELNIAAVPLSAIADVYVPKYFLADVSVNTLYEIMNAGRQNKQYVFCCSFDGATASEPVLQAWDDDNLTSTLSVALGGGVASQSWYKAICTTNALPGVNWNGTPLAGNSSSYSVLLNAGAGALSVAKDLYFNFHVKIPAGTSTPGISQPVLAIVYATN